MSDASPDKPWTGDKPAAPKKPVIKVNVLHCRSQTCEALLAYEETSEGLLLGNMYLLAQHDGDLAFFPCPRCGGRNIVVEVEHGGRMRSKVTGFEPKPS
ncbi:MAG: hypothetical protein ACI8TX_000569 [Hyphomicrobiaceae bacterium]|jgi:hypothetical protein